jgi:hypothetical protein
MAQFTESEAQAILQKVLGFSKADECEATLTGGRSGNLRFARNAVSTSGGKELASLEVQSSFGKKTGTATINEFDDESLEKVVRRAEELAQLAPENAEYVEFLGSQEYLEPKLTSIRPATSTRHFARVPRPRIIKLSKDKKARSGRLPAARRGLYGRREHARPEGAIIAVHGVDFSVTIRTPDGKGSGYGIPRL